MSSIQGAGHPTGHTSHHHSTRRLTTETRSAYGLAKSGSRDAYDSDMA